ncbi:CHP [Lepeophtheirus salmonis]|uniref:CHP n=1 Tax=Lepeophtheirus salmonis TaxID=72036 RepID=A0A7R8CUH6_LEPSM|nr:CHP [Lepeophtheirus salmonis]CAF2936751.1 CHP [Lepeophtheirus salmonis]
MVIIGLPSGSLLTRKETRKRSDIGDLGLLIYWVTSNQIERLWSRFTSLDKHQKGYLSREDFLRIPELAINPLGDRIVHAFFKESRNSESDIVNFPDFVRVLAHFRPLKKNADKNKMNSRKEKLHIVVAFRMYDLDGDDKISKEELLAVLTMMVGANISEDQLLSIAERTIIEADKDKDNLISFQEFNLHHLSILYGRPPPKVLLSRIIISGRLNTQYVYNVPIQFDSCTQIVNFIAFGQMAHENPSTNLSRV